MKARDIMTSPIITVRPETPVPEIAALLFERRISGVPVMDDARLVGLISEADLLHRHEIGTDRVAPSGSWWRQLFSADRSPAAAYVKSHAMQARDIMTREVISVAEDTPVAEIATLLETRGIRRVPVLDGERLAGIVSRANLIKALAVKGRSRKAARPDGDGSIRHRLLGELKRQPWWRVVSSSVIVTDGVVHYWGTVVSEDERRAARVAAENVPGVRRIEDHRLRLSELPSML